MTHFLRSRVRRWFLPCERQCEDCRANSAYVATKLVGAPPLPPYRDRVREAKLNRLCHAVAGSPGCIADALAERTHMAVTVARDYLDALCRSGRLRRRLRPGTGKAWLYYTPGWREPVQAAKPVERPQQKAWPSFADLGPGRYLPVDNALARRYAEAA